MSRSPVALALLVAMPSFSQPAEESLAPAPDETATGAPLEASLTVEVSTTTATVGDRLDATLTFTAGAPLAEPPRFPIWEEHWGDAEILEVDEPVDEGNGVWRQHLALTLFETGLATLPAVEVEMPTTGLAATVTSEPTIVDVESVLPSGEEEIAPQPPEPVRALPAGRSFWWAAAILGSACAILGFLLLRAMHRVHTALAALALSPIEALGQAIRRLRAEPDPERLFTGLSLELRRYLGRAIGFPAAEGTTTEIQRQLRDQQLSPDLIRETLALLREADQIKFARRATDPERAGRRLDDAERLARDVEEWLRPPTEDEAEPEVAA
jgi:hypothetical protein